MKALTILQALLCVFLVLGPIVRADQNVENSKAVKDDEAKLECVCNLLPCLPEKQKKSVTKIKNTVNLRHGPQTDIDARARQTGGEKGFSAITDIARGCVTISDTVFKDPPDIGLKKRVLIHEGTHLGQRGEYGRSCRKIKKCFASPTGALSQTGKDLLNALQAYMEVDAGAKTLPHLGNHASAAKGEATYLAGNLDDLCKGMAALAESDDPKLDDDEVKAMRHAFKKCASAAKKALEAYNADANSDDTVAVPASAASK